MVHQLIIPSIIIFHKGGGQWRIGKKSVEHGTPLSIPSKGIDLRNITPKHECMSLYILRNSGESPYITTGNTQDSLKP